MNNPKFESLVARLEKSAANHPQRYTLAVIAVAALGFCILGLVVGFALLNAAVLLGLVAAVFLTGGKALIVLAKLGKLLVLLAIPAWTMIKSSTTLLLSRFPAPSGRALAPAEAPALFARLDELRASMKGPRIDAVLLSDEINAAIVQHPRFGLLGWERNYLILGLPLLQTLGEAEALAVVAHEYGHLSGQHGRLGGFIYRFRAAWGRLQALSEQWNDWGSRLIARLFRWYAPYFNAYTFVLARQNEYLADRAAVEVAGRDNAANALMRTDIAAHFAAAEFWPAIDRRVAAEAEPPGDRSAFWEASLRAGLDAAQRSRFLDLARQRQTDHLDTHPALADRLAAIGASADAAAAQRLAPPPISAATVWLGPRLPAIRGELDAAWRQRVAEPWSVRHAYLRERRERLADLEDRELLSTDEQWERIGALGELRPEEDLAAPLEALLAAAPEHLPARFRRGTLRLERGDESGVADLEAVMAADPEAILAGCEAAARFYDSRDAGQAQHYRQRGEERAAYLAGVRAELARLPVDADLAPAELPAEAAEAIAAVLREHGKYIHHAYLLRRKLKSDPGIHDYVLAFETKRLTLGEKGPAVLKRLAKQSFPVAMFVVHLGTPPYKRFRKVIRRQGIAPLAFR